MRIVFALLIIVCLLSSCGFSASNEHIKNSIADAENESSQIFDEESGDAVGDFEYLSGLTLLSETEYRIKDDIPPFTFKSYSNDENSDYVSELYVFDAEADTPVCNFKIGGLWDAPGVPADIYKIEFIDVDFDGYKDIRIFGGANGNWNIYYIYFIWASDVGRFIDDPYGLGGLGLPTFDEENRLVHSMTRASAADHWYYTYQYVEGKLVTIEEVSDNCVWNHWLDYSAIEQIKAIEPLYEEDNTFMHVTKKQLDKDIMKLVITEEKYVLFSGEVEIAEYAADSEMGLLLRGYER